MKEKNHKKLNSRFNIDNIEALNKHVVRAQYLLEEFKKETEIISNFQVQIDNK